MPAGSKEKQETGARQIKQDLSQLTANEAVKTKRFWYLWIMLFINVTCGIAILSVASPMAQEIVSMTPLDAATMVGLLGLFNGLGRIGWASLSDYIGRPNMFTAFFVIQIIAYFLLPESINVILFQILLFLIITCYGGGFASIQAYIGDLFGTKQLGAIHGNILTAWSAAGVADPIFAALFIVALVVSLLIRLDIKKLRPIDQPNQLDTLR